MQHKRHDLIFDKPSARSRRQYAASFGDSNTSYGYPQPRQCLPRHRSRYILSLEAGTPLYEEEIRVDIWRFLPKSILASFDQTPPSIEHARCQTGLGNTFATSTHVRETYKAVVSGHHELVRELVPDIRFRKRYFMRKLSDEEVLQAAKEWLCGGSTLRPMKIYPTYDGSTDTSILTTSAADIVEACHVSPNCDRRTVWSRRKRSEERVRIAARRRGTET
jgi:hypothetical protein